jgi:alanine-synthesizing transaminase
VLINPNNPTGAVYSEETVRGFVDLATRHDLVLMGDEIYEKILYDGARHVHAATFAQDILCLTFSGLSKAYRIAGFRSGWVVVTGARERATDFLEGLTLLANMRMCANVPAQHAIQRALGGHQSINDLVLPGGRLREQRDVAHQLPFALVPLAVVVGPGGGNALDRAERRLIEDPFESLVAAGGTARVTDLPGLGQHR